MDKANTGYVEAIYRSPSVDAPMERVLVAQLLAGRGVEGDRYTLGRGTFSSSSMWPKDHELTLIEAEAIEAVAREEGYTLAPEDLRRNLVTRGIRLNDLVGQEFTIGEVRCRGTRLCPPCRHLDSITHLPLTGTMANRCGLRAVILADGPVAVGDVVAPAVPPGE